MLWDIFCRVIDNFGDIGVCWRLCTDLAGRGQKVRFWVDDASALQWLAPGALEGHWLNVQVRLWAQAGDADSLRSLHRSDIWIEAFGCEIPLSFVAHFATAPIAKQPVWLNLEYLSAEPYVERCHGLPSPVMHGPAKGWIKYFFYPGLSAKTGGLMQGPTQNAGPGPSAGTQRERFFAQSGINWQGERVLSLFCYEPPLLGPLLEHLATGTQSVLLLVTAGRASAAVRAQWGAQTQHGNLQLCFLPLLTQVAYDGLLAASDVNFVRGEDSVVRALWTGKPFVWQIYPQEDGAHAVKLEAFMQRLGMNTATCELHRAWNGMSHTLALTGVLQPLLAENLHPWQVEAQAGRQSLLKLPDLGQRLVEFALENS